MSLSCGIVGLPNAGKSTLFNGLTRGRAVVASYPFTTIDPNVGVVEVPDGRLARLAEIIKPEKLTPAVVTFVDIAGLVRGASRGEGLGNKFLGHIREVDCIAHVVRCFEDDSVAHVSGGLDPRSDMEVVELELILADLDTVERRLARSSKAARVADRREAHDAALLESLRSGLEKGLPARAVVEEIATGRGALSAEDRALLSGLFMLTAKPMAYVANVSERQLAGAAGGTAAESGQAAAVGLDPLVSAVVERARSRGCPAVVVCARLEEELGDLDPAEAREYLREIGAGGTGFDALVLEAYRALDLITFYTTKGPETRAWSARAGTTAPRAAGMIHSDMEKGFIKAEVVAFEELEAAGSMGAARDRGLVRLEGKDYVIRDGDVVLFKFSV